MKQVEYRQPGPIDVLHVVTKAPVPKLPSNGDSKLVLIKVKAAGLNPVDWKLRSVGTGPFAKYPIVPGSDFCGVVVESSPGGKFKNGDVVFGMLPVVKQFGSLSEYLIVGQEKLALKPNNISEYEAAVVPLVGSTALQALRAAGITGIEEKKTILIHAGSGGLGHVAIQIARAINKQFVIYTTCSKKNESLVKSLGADVAIDYHTTKFEELGVKFDYILDCMGGDYELRGMKCISKHGTYISIMNSGWPAYWNSSKPDGVTGADSKMGMMLGLLYSGYRMLFQFITGPWYKLILVQPSKDDIDTLASLLSKKQLKPIIAASFPVEKVHDAFKFLETGHAVGKVVVTL